MFLLPVKLSALADIAAKDSTRYAMQGVQISVNDGEYSAMATDGKVAIKVVGNTIDSEKYPAAQLAALDTAPNGKTTAVVPAPAWKKVFKNAEKLTKSAKRIKPEIHSVATVLGESVATFGATNLDETPIDSVRLLAGHFPPVDQVIADTKKRKDAVRVDAKILIKALEAFVAMAQPSDGGCVQVTIETNGDKPIRLSAQTTDTKIVGIVMPLS